MAHLKETTIFKQNLSTKSLKLKEKKERKKNVDLIQSIQLYPLQFQGSPLHQIFASLEQFWLHQFYFSRAEKGVREVNSDKRCKNHEFWQSKNSEFWQMD